MCGLVGVVRFEDWGIGWKEREVFQQLLVAGGMRGTHGTGVFLVKNNGKARSLKIGSGPYSLLGDKTWADFFEHKQIGAYDSKAPRDIIAIGHNRYRTGGKKTTEHAHPHKCGNILLVHNGTIPSYSDLPDFNKFDVDTQGLVNAIDKLGIDEAISKTHGSYALIYYDEKEKTLNVLRNNERPLWIGTDEKNKRFAFASEKMMLEWILDRNDIHSLFTFSPISTNTLYTWELGEQTPKMREVKGPKVVSYYRGQTTWREDTEAEIVHAMGVVERSKRIPVEFKKKQIKGIIKKAGKIGVSINILEELKGLKRESPVVFKIMDYAEENPEKESFIVMGESKRLPSTSIRFRVKGEKTLQALFEIPDVVATVRNILEYPEKNETDDKYVMWVSNPAVYIPKTAVKSHVDTYGREVLPINQSLTLYEDPDTL